MVDLRPVDADPVGHGTVAETVTVTREREAFLDFVFYMLYDCALRHRQGQRALRRRSVPYELGQRRGAKRDPRQSGSPGRRGLLPGQFPSHRRLGAAGCVESAEFWLSQLTHLSANATAQCLAV